MGCKEKEWKKIDGMYRYKWVGKGTLLGDGLCIGNDYARYVVPSKGNTIVYSTITGTKVREIDLSKGTVSVDFTLNMRWLDPNIKKQFHEDGTMAGFLVLSKDAIDKIWTPDLYIHDSRSFKPQDEWTSLKSSFVLTRQIPGISIENETHAIIEVQYGVKTTTFCLFDPAAYPMDLQTCNVTLGSGSFEAIFVL